MTRRAESVLTFFSVTACFIGFVFAFEALGQKYAVVIPIVGITLLALFRVVFLILDTRWWMARVHCPNGKRVHDNCDLCDYRFKKHIKRDWPKARALGNKP